MSSSVREGPASARRPPHLAATFGNPLIPDEHYGESLATGRGLGRPELLEEL